MGDIGIPTLFAGANGGMDAYQDGFVAMTSVW